VAQLLAVIRVPDRHGVLVIGVRLRMLLFSQLSALWLQRPERKKTLVVLLVF